MTPDPGGRPCRVCSHPDRGAIEALAATASQAEACRRYGIAKGSMSRHLAAHLMPDGSKYARDADAAAVDLKSIKSPPVAALIPYARNADADADADLVSGGNSATPGTIEPAEPTNTRAQATTAAPIDTPSKRSETPWPPSGIGQTPSSGARCSRCRGATWWRREADGFTACMACKPITGRYLPPGIAFITT